MNKKQPFYKTGSPLYAHISKSKPKLGHGPDGLAPQVVGNPRSNIVGGTVGNQGAMLNGAVSGLRSIFQGIYNLGNTTTTTRSGGNTKKEANKIISDSEDYSYTADNSDPPWVDPTNIPTTPGKKSTNGGGTNENKESRATTHKDEGSGGGGGVNTSFMKDYSKLPSSPNDLNVGKDLVKNSAKGILTRHGGSITRDGKLIKTYDSDVSASGRAGRKARKQMKRDDKAAGLTRPERRERKLMAKAMASQRAAGLGFEAGDNMSAEIGKSGQAMLSPSQSHFTTEREAGLDYGGKARKKGMRLINKTNNFISRQRSQTSQGSALEPGIRRQYSESESLSDKLKNRGANNTDLGSLTNETYEISKQGQKIQDQINAGSSYKPRQEESIEKTVSKGDNKKDKKGIKLPGTGISRGNLESGGPLNQLGSAVSKGDKSIGKQVVQKQAFYKTGTPFHNHTPGDQGVKHKQMVDGNDVGGNDSTTYDSKGSGYGMNNEAVTSDARFKDKKLSDFAMNSQERRDYYTARGMAQDYTTELSSDNTDVVEPEVKAPVVVDQPVESGGDDGEKPEVKAPVVVEDVKDVTENTIDNKEEQTGLSPKKKGGGKMGLISETQEGVFFKKGPLYKIKKMVRK